MSLGNMYIVLDYFINIKIIFAYSLYIPVKYIEYRQAWCAYKLILFLFS